MPAFDLYDRDDTSGYMNPALMDEAEKLARRKAELKDRAIMAAKQIGVYKPIDPKDLEQPGWTSAVTGTRMVTPLAKVSKFAPYAPLAATVADAFSQHRLDKDVSSWNRMEALVAKDFMASKPPDDAPEKVKLEWAQMGSTIPSLAPVMKEYMADLTIKAPERAEAREYRATEAEKARIARAEEAEARRNWETTQKDADRSLRETIAQLVHGGDKAANYTTVTDNEGNVALVDKVNKKTYPLGKIGKPSATSEKTAAAEAKSVADATNALELVGFGRDYLKKATGSGFGAIIDKGYRWIGETNEGMTAGRALKQLSGQLTAQVPRFEGPQSNIDVEYYKQQAGDVGNEELTREERQAALVEVERMLRTKIGKSGKGKPIPKDDKVAPSSGGGGGVDIGFSKEPTVRESVEAAIRQHGEPTGGFQGEINDVLKQIQGIKDPVERDLALRAYVNQTMPGGSKLAGKSSSSIDDLVNKYSK